MEGERIWFEDERSDLNTIRTIMAEGYEERLRSMLADDAEYVSDIGRWNKKGVDEIIRLFKYIREVRDEPYKYMYIATLVETNQVDMDYPPGKPCMVLDDENEEEKSLMFLTYDSNNRISRIEFVSGDKYKYEIPKVVY